MLIFNRAVVVSSLALRRQYPKARRVFVARSFRTSAPQCVEVPNFMGFLSNTESEKAQQITQEVSKKQVLADDDDDEDMEEMFIMVGIVCSVLL